MANRVEMVGDDLHTGEGRKLIGFGSQLAEDPFLAGIRRGSAEPINDAKETDYSMTNVGFILDDTESFQRAITDDDQWQHFQHGWMASIGLGIEFATDDLAQEDRLHDIQNAFDFFKTPVDSYPEDLIAELAIYLREREFRKLKTGMYMFTRPDRTPDDYTTYGSDVDSFFGDITRRIHIQMFGEETWREPDLATLDAEIEAAAKVVTTIESPLYVVQDELAQRTEAAFRLGYFSMAFEYSKNGLFDFKASTV